MYMDTASSNDNLAREAHVPVLRSIAELASSCEAGRDAFRARGLHNLLAGQLLRALGDQEAVATSKTLGTLTLSIQVGSTAGALAQLVRPSDYEDASSQAWEAVSQLARALLLRANDAAEVPSADINAGLELHKAVETLNLFAAAALLTAVLAVHSRDPPKQIVDAAGQLLMRTAELLQGEETYDVGSVRWKQHMLIGCRCLSQAAELASSRHLFAVHILHIGDALGRLLDCDRLLPDIPTANDPAAVAVYMDCVRHVASELATTYTKVLKRLHPIPAIVIKNMVEPLLEIYRRSDKKGLLTAQAQRALDALLQPVKEQAGAVAEAAAAALLKEEEAAAARKAAKQKKKAKQKAKPGGPPPAGGPSAAAPSPTSPDGSQPQRTSVAPEQAWHAQFSVEEMECPITQVFMTDPVIAADGHSYEKSAIEEWFSRHDTSPMTGLVLDC
ncbi:hypothetical protein WJX72_008634 [[Myrmecia] bisecta]|uniref:U-box domain-containing protein n=1 Tax=[Myrmecia] bisecta TaxID=41462 RepID=A0AAW1P3N5_9CHLO